MNDPLVAYRSGSTEPWTVQVVKALIAAKYPKVLLETGTYLGLTTLVMSEVLTEGAILHTVDNFSADGTIPQKILEHPQIEFHKADIMDWLREYDGPPIEFAFVDDDHDPEHVYNELVLLKTKMAKDGLICGHDVHGIFNLDKVYNFLGGVSLKFPLLHAAGGLGLIQL